MFKFVAIFALLAIASAQHHAYGSHGAYNSPSYGGGHSTHSVGSSDDIHAEVKSLHSDVRADGYDYGLETSNSIHAQSSGDVHGNMHGDYEWVSPEGVHVKVSYVADENGYQPSSDLLPTPPPVPVAILKALEYIRAHPAKEEHYGGHHH